MFDEILSLRLSRPVQGLTVQQYCWCNILTLNLVGFGLSDVIFSTFSCVFDTSRFPHVIYEVFAQTGQNTRQINTKLVFPLSCAIQNAWMCKNTKQINSKLVFSLPCAHNASSHCEKHVQNEHWQRKCVPSKHGQTRPKVSPASPTPKIANLHKKLCKGKRFFSHLHFSNFTTIKTKPKAAQQTLPN